MTSGAPAAACPRQQQQAVVRGQRRQQVADHEDRHQQHQRGAPAEPAHQQGHHRRAQHHAHGIGRDQHAGGGDVHADAVGNDREQAHRGELGGTDGEGADGKGQQSGSGIHGGFLRGAGLGKRARSLRASPCRIKPRSGETLLPPLHRWRVALRRVCPDKPCNAEPPAVPGVLDHALTSCRRPARCVRVRGGASAGSATPPAPRSPSRRRCRAWARARPGRPGSVPHRSAG
ncbi:hypothetical protein G6F24_014653 [Rhizopus arrhizus]|nr:hypothetical protein G6F24_014653 [Rhizopus arrhizus]